LRDTGLGHAPVDGAEDRVAQLIRELHQTTGEIEQQHEQADRARQEL
jgi:hypothetical protein